MNVTIGVGASKQNGNILVSDAQGVALYANDGIVARTGYSVAQIIGSKPGKLWGGRMPRLYYDAMWQSIRDRNQPFSGVVTNQNKDGKAYHELLAVAPLQCASRAKYYIALRPQSLENQDQFIEEWRGLFGQPRLSAKKVLPWLRRWFPRENLAEADESGLFADWVEAAWVAPLRARFAARFDDRGLVAAAQRDPKRFQHLYEKYYPTVRNYFNRHLPGQEDQVLDLTQDTFVRAFERLDGYEVRNATYGTYLLRIAHSLLLNTYRQKPMLELATDLSLPNSRAVADLFWVWETPELSARERTVLSAYYREGFSVREISQGLEISENAAKLLLSRARKKLRPLLGSA